VKAEKRLPIDPRDRLQHHQPGKPQPVAQPRPPCRVKLQHPGQHRLKRPIDEHTQSGQRRQQIRLQPLQRQIERGEQWIAVAVQLGLEGRGDIGDALLLQHQGQHEDRQRMEPDLAEQRCHRLRPRHRHDGLGRQAQQGLKPVQRVRRLQPVQRQIAAEVAALGRKVRMRQIVRARGDQHPAPPLFGPARGGAEQLRPRVVLQRFEVVQDQQRRPSRQRGPRRLRVQQVRVQHRRERADRELHRIGALKTGVGHETHAVEQPGAQQPASGLGRQRGLALAAEPGQHDPPRAAGEPSLDVV
jgi:hypothetical protein